MQNKIKLFLLILFIIFASSHIYFLKIDKLPPFHDELREYYESITYLNILRTSPCKFFSKKIFTGVIPPFYRLVPLPFYLLFGKNADVMVGTNILWVGLLIISVYGLGKKLTGVFCGLISVIILLGFPAIIGFSRWCHYVIALAAMVTLNYYLLINSRFFEDRKNSSFYAISYIIGLLIHPYFLIYTIPGMIFACWNIKNRLSRRNFLTALFLIMVISALWYIPVLIFEPSRNFLFALFKKRLFTEDVGFFLN